MTHPKFRNHAEEITATRAAHDADRTAANTHSAHSGPLVLPAARARYLDSLPGKPEPAPANVRFMARLCIVLVGCIAAALAMIAAKGGA